MFGKLWGSVPPVHGPLHPHIHQEPLRLCCSHLTALTCRGEGNGERGAGVENSEIQNQRGCPQEEQPGGEEWVGPQPSHLGVPGGQSLGERG